MSEQGRPGRARGRHRSIVLPRRSARRRSTSRSRKSLRVRTNLTGDTAAATAQRPADRAGSADRALGRIFQRSNVISSRSRARSKRCSVPTGSSNRSLRSAANWPEIRHAITEAMPRRAIELIENEIRSLSRRIDDTRQSGTDGPGAGRHRTRAQRNPRSVALADARRTTGGLRRGDPQSRRQARPDFARQRRPLHDSASSKAPSPPFAPSSPMSRPMMRWCGSATTSARCPSKVDQLARSDGHSDVLRDPRTAHRRADLDAGKPRDRPAASDNSEHLEEALRALSDRLDRIPVGNDNASAFAHLEQRVVLFARTPRMRPPITAPAISAGSRTGCRTFCAISKPSSANFAALAESSRRTAAPRRQRPVRHRQARIVRYPFQPVGNRPSYPGFARNRSQHARPCGRSAGDDRRRSARGTRCRPIAPQAETSPAPQAALPQPAAAQVAMGPQQTRIAESRRGAAAFRHRSPGIPCRAITDGGCRGRNAESDQ